MVLQNPQVTKRGRTKTRSVGASSENPFARQTVSRALIDQSRVPSVRTDDSLPTKAEKGLAPLAVCRAGLFCWRLTTWRLEVEFRSKLEDARVKGRSDLAEIGRAEAVADLV